MKSNTHTHTANEIRANQVKEEMKKGNQSDSRKNDLLDELHKCMKRAFRKYSLREKTNIHKHLRSSKALNEETKEQHMERKKDGRRS